MIKLDNYNFGNDEVGYGLNCSGGSDGNGEGDGKSYGYGDGGSYGDGESVEET